MVLKRTIPLLVFLNKKNGYPLLLFSTQTNKKFVILSFAFSIPSNLNLDISKQKRGNLVLLTTISSSPLPLVLLSGYPHAWSFVPGARPTVQRRNSRRACTIDANTNHIDIRTNCGTIASQPKQRRIIASWY